MMTTPQERERLRTAYRMVLIPLDKAVILWRERLYQHLYHGEATAPWERGRRE